MKVKSDKAAAWIANAILKVQDKFSNALGKLSASWKGKQQWIFLYSVCIVFGGLSISAIVTSFHKHRLSKPAAIKLPLNIYKENPAARITENEFRQIQKFKRSLDSASRQKLAQERPGLMDSLDMVERLYYSQKK